MHTQFNSPDNAPTPHTTHNLSVLDQMVSHIFDTTAVGGACTIEDLALGGFTACEIDVYATEAASIARRRFVKQLAEVN